MNLRIINWKNFLKGKRERFAFFFSFLLMVSLFFITGTLLDFNEARPGVIINDPILDLFNPINLNWITFFLIYSSIILAVIKVSPNPDIFTTACLAYSVMLCLRLITIFLLPLEPPATMIPLVDPIVSAFAKGSTPAKDLFFSGHTGTMIILLLSVQEKNLKRLFFVLTLLVGVAVILQHVHYTIDVFAAFFFAPASFYLGNKLINRILNN